MKNLGSISSDYTPEEIEISNFSFIDEQAKTPKPKSTTPDLKLSDLDSPTKVLSSDTLASPNRRFESASKKSSKVPSRESEEAHSSKSSVHVSFIPSKESHKSGILTLEELVGSTPLPERNPNADETRSSKSSYRASFIPSKESHKSGVLTLEDLGGSVSLSDHKSSVHKNSSSKSSGHAPVQKYSI